jgi:uncharacterized protein (DUF2237 family)
MRTSTAAFCCVCAIATTRIEADCSSKLPPDGVVSLNKIISDNPVVLFGLDNYRCTMAAEQSLLGKRVCYKKRIFTGATDPRLAYLRCVHAEKIGGINGGKNMWHSYLYINGKYVGDGFKVDSVASFGTARMTCHKKCNGILSGKEHKELYDVIDNKAVALFGWGGCPCTNIARNRFNNLGVCYMQNVWPDWSDPKFKYLQCVYGDDNHSFVFFKGKFYGNGFKFDEKLLSKPKLGSLLTHAGASLHCIKKGDTGLSGKPIQSCTQSNDGTTTGWMRTGSCNWDPSDGGYHEVCVTMTEEFLQSSAKNDANDLSSVVQPGGHWCICAWAFASAVERDPAHMQGIKLDCGRTNDRLRHVYQHFIDEGKKLTSPSGASYEASTALSYVNELCGDDSDESPHTSPRKGGAMNIQQHVGGGHN